MIHSSRSVRSRLARSATKNLPPSVSREDFDTACIVLSKVFALEHIQGAGTRSAIVREIATAMSARGDILRLRTVSNADEPSVALDDVPVCTQVMALHCLRVRAAIDKSSAVRQHILIEDVLRTFPIIKHGTGVARAIDMLASERLVERTLIAPVFVWITPNGLDEILFNNL